MGLQTNDFILYGYPHSPFTQRVMMVMHLYGIKNYKLILFPTAAMFKLNGFVMPMLEHKDHVIYDSFNIIEYIINHFSKPVKKRKFFVHNDKISSYNQLDKLFESYVLSRRYWYKSALFFRSCFYTIDMCEMSNFDLIKMPTCPLYMFTILQWTRILFFNSPSINKEMMNNALSHFDNFVKTESDYHSSDDITLMDLTLYSHIQCMCCSLTDETLPFIFQHSNLIKWIHKMNITFSDYPYKFTSCMIPEQFLKLLEMPINERAPHFIQNRVKYKVEMDTSQKATFLSSFIIQILLSPLLGLFFCIPAFKRKSGMVHIDKKIC